MPLEISKTLDVSSYKVPKQTPGVVGMAEAMIRHKIKTTNMSNAEIIHTAGNRIASQGGYLKMVKTEQTSTKAVIDELLELLKDKNEEKAIPGADHLIKALEKGLTLTKLGKDPNGRAILYLQNKDKNYEYQLHFDGNDIKVYGQEVKPTPSQGAGR